MCGIFGLISKSEIDNLNVIAVDAATSIVHRGPDDNGIFTENNKVLLGHVRLSILDLSSAGHQPMFSSKSNILIIHNGEIYNFKELANEYNISELKSSSDTEVLLRLFEKLGIEAFDKLNGMFAFAIYDKIKRKLWLVRDRLGVKPLYYKIAGGELLFASEIKAISAMQGEGVQAVNQKAIHEWAYYGNTLGGKTLYKDINKLSPGHYLEIDVDTLEFTDNAYWSIEKQVNSTESLRNSWAESNVIHQTRNHLEEAVKRQLVSDVPVGVFLSGGIDSSAITAFASKHYSGRVSTYSVGFDFDKEECELPRARMMAERYNTDHHEIHISGFNIADIVEKMVMHNDSPFSDAANIPLFLLCNDIKDKTKVVLQGDGGDELFGGYQRYATLSHITKMKLIAPLLGVANQFMPRNSGYYRRQRYFNMLKEKDDAELMALLLTVEDKKLSPLNIFSSAQSNHYKKFDPFERYRYFSEKYTHQDAVNKMLLVDLSIILPDIFLEKVDRATMAASVEVRVPFLDNDLVNFSLSLDSKVKLKGGTKKWLLKKSLEGIVPNEILYGKKSGFGVPFEYWIKTSLYTLLNDNLLTFDRAYPDIFDMKYIEKLINIHKSGGRDFGFLLWKVLNFTIWANTRKLDFSCYE